MKWLSIVVLAIVIALTLLAGWPFRAGAEGAGTAAPIYGVTLPDGYRDWRLIAVAHEKGKLNDLRAVLGNDIAVKAARAGTYPFPDGAIIARLAWDYHPLEESVQAFGSPQSWVAGAPKNGAQFMVKDSKKYAASGGWGYAQFDDGKPAPEAAHAACHPCHRTVAGRDFVFNRYAR